MKHVAPLGLDAPSDRFSEARVVEHIRQLTVEIDGRQVSGSGSSSFPIGLGDGIGFLMISGSQEGHPGLEEAAKYIRKELETIASRAGPDYKFIA
ncbi:hypothetical protein BHE74_00040287 [Ensete ventricosum]|nr:hypothetical protein BHE74_00040287 [Ensete ventricosum]